MTRTRWLIVAFWVFVGAMLLWQCHTGQVRLDQQEDAHPDDAHYFFTAPPVTSTAPAQPAAPTNGPDVHQIAFTVHPDTPGAGSFTCDVTVRNDGQQTARGIQVHVRPFRGVMYGSDGLGHVGYHPLQESDPISQYGEWLTFPDLKPGESATESAVFFNHPNVNPGYNPNPEITFEPAK